MFPCLCISMPQRGIRCLSCGIMSLFSFASQPSSLRRAFIAVPPSFPDCGCKITAFFAPVQIFPQHFCYFPDFYPATRCRCVKSINVKISFGLLSLPRPVNPFLPLRVVFFRGSEILQCFSPRKICRGTAKDTTFPGFLPPAYIDFS